MKRSTGNYKGVPYIKYEPTTLKPIGTILFLSGLGERGNDIKDGVPSIIERNDIPKQAASDGFEQPYIIIAPQLPLSMGGWWENITNPIMEFVSLLGLDVHLTGLSLGSMVGPTLVKNNPGFFKTLASVCGKVDFTDTIELQRLYTELAKVPSIFYYDPADKTIPDGFDSVARLYTALKGKADITLKLLTGPTINGIIQHHNIWGQAYAPDNYWAWLGSKIQVVTPPTGSPTIWVNGTDTKIPGPITNIEVKTA